ncbi:MAG: polysaccharide deacetylase family protein [Candidatus Eremiobacteraeota bacterium]|nr:polysaccharide deacetylase family protein [Candidatus Eremiobacteraeota bacterium]
MKGPRRIALGVLVGVALVLSVFVARHLSAPVIPALVTRTDDAHRELSPSIGARVDRLLHDRPPAARDRGLVPRLVALTFDDGPYPVETPLLLDVLADEHVPATFFLIGRDSEQFPELARRISREGHEIANHTQTHPAAFEALSPAGVRRELAEGAQTLERYSKDRAIRSIMRPPHGRFTETTVRVAQSAGYDVVLWNDDPGDWRSVPPETLETHIGSNATSPDIVLLHSGRLNTVEALPAIIARFRAAGFSFVTVGELIARVPAASIDHPAKLKV